MSLREAIRRWWAPAAWADEHPDDARVRPGVDHPLDGEERRDEKTRGRHWWTEAANQGGHAALGHVDLERDLRKRP
jgi:hypothetical protein